MKHSLKIFVSLLILGISSIGYSSAADWDLPEIDIITRAERGADESLRYLSRSKGEIAAENTAKEQARLEQLKQTNPTAYQTELKKIAAAKETAAKNAQIASERNTYMKASYENDRTYDFTRDKSSDDQRFLLYQDQIKINKTKLIVHHTAMEYNYNWTTEEIHQAIQRIYKYHTIDRNFGDIGYNFLIDHLGNIYEGRAGGEGAIGMHVAYNNIPSVGISLMGNYEETQPNELQLRALVQLLTALADKYGIDPLGKERYHQPSATSPYMTSKQNRTILGHGDIAPTACPGQYLSRYLPFIRTEVAKRLEGEIFTDVELGFSVSGTGANDIQLPQTGESQTSNAQTPSTFSEGFGTRLLALRAEHIDIFTRATTILKEKYSTKHNISAATNLINKIEYGYTLPEIKKLITQDIPVLLYELTAEYERFEISCEGGCNISVDGESLERTGAIISFLPEGIFIQSEKISNSFLTEEIIVTPIGDLIEIVNYDRSSYAGIPRNTFRGKLIFKHDIYRNLEKGVLEAPVVINTLPFSDYMKGIVETNDTEHLEKNKVMAVISKTYALFYLEKKNLHPSIPAEAEYTAVDSADIFQKYAGAGVEKTLTKREQALIATENLIPLYDGKLPILPYSSCSAGFTRPALEKWGWKDTPYLTATFDLAPCSDFKGHGVGLAGQGAQYLAEKGATFEEILLYFYPGLGIVEIEETGNSTENN